MKKFAIFGVGMTIALFVSVVLAQSSEHPKKQTADREETQSGTRGLRPEQQKENAMKVHYLEIVTPSVDETCDALAKAHGATFSEPVAELGNARTAKLKDGGRIGVRAPMGEEQPVVRPYVLVDDIHTAVKAAKASGAEMLMPTTEIPGHGTFAIYYLGKIEHGLWQL